MSDLQNRLAITMWEFSWLVRRTGAENEYADWDRVLDELVERGYGCIRIDAFPHLVAAGTDGKRPERFTVRPQPRQFMWGNHAPVVVDPRRGLIGFLGKAADRGLRIGLSAWFNDDDLHRRDSIADAGSLARIWIETLSFLQAEGLLDLVEWVDLCNEFPLASWLPKVSRRLFGGGPTDLRVLFSRWTPDQRGAVGRFMQEAIDAVRNEFPSLRYTFSLTSWNTRSTFRTDVSALDLIEAHVWISDAIEWNARTGHPLMLVLPFARTQAALYSKRAREVWHRDPDRWLDRLGEGMDRWKDWADARHLPLFTTEGWASVMYDDVPSAPGTSEWGWFKEASEEAVRMAVARGWTGICTSNFAQPHFRGMWDDLSWHQRLNSAISGTVRPSALPLGGSRGAQDG